jgi:hypothetical protein
MLECNACQGLADSRVGTPGKRAHNLRGFSPGRSGSLQTAAGPSLIAGLGEHIV